MMHKNLWVFVKNRGHFRISRLENPLEFTNKSNFSLVLHCCSYEGLRLSQEVGMATIGPGEILTAGEVVRNGRQISFDVIANVKKVVNDGQ
jgi:hypothetical protein